MKLVWYLLWEMHIYIYIYIYTYAEKKMVILMQDCSISSALTMEILQSCTEPSLSTLDILLWQNVIHSFFVLGNLWPGLTTLCNLHFLMQTSLDKTSKACQRRLRYILKNTETATNVNMYLGEALQDKVGGTKCAAEQPKLLTTQCMHTYMFL